MRLGAVALRAVLALLTPSRAAVAGCRELGGCDGTAADRVELLQRGVRTRSRASPGPGAGGGPCKLLVFQAVGAKPQVIQLVSQGIGKLRSSFWERCAVDVFLAHYDGQRERWREALGAEWYDANVQHSAEPALGGKFHLMGALLPGLDLEAYDWVWALDEDIDLGGTDLPALLRSADASGALLATPAFIQDGKTERERTLSYPFQAPNPNCTYRYAPMVEVLAPLLRPQVLRLVLGCKTCYRRHSIWGLNRIWCGLSAQAFGHNASITCAVLDTAPVVHRNWRTLKGKYDAEGTLVQKKRTTHDGSEAFATRAHADLMFVYNFHKRHFVRGSSQSIVATECVSNLP